MIEEIQYAYTINQNENHETENKNVETPIQTESESEIPISVEIIPYKAILIENINASNISNISNTSRRYRNQLLTYKYCFFFFMCIPLTMVMLSYFVSMLKHH